jgi:hypothetical protein
MKEITRNALNWKSYTINFNALLMAQLIPIHFPEHLPALALYCNQTSAF